jgi:hypothetical protein
LDNGLKSLLWGIVGIGFSVLIFPSVLAIKYGILGWNGRNYIASRIGFFLGVIELLIVLSILSVHPFLQTLQLVTTNTLMSILS